MFEIDFKQRSHTLYYRNFGYWITPGTLDFGYQLFHGKTRIAQYSDRSILYRSWRFNKNQKLTCF